MDVEIYINEKAMMSHHYFLGNTNHNKSVLQFLYLIAIYALAFVPSKKDASVLSFSSFCFQVK